MQFRHFFFAAIGYAETRVARSSLQADFIHGEVSAGMPLKIGAKVPFRRRLSSQARFATMWGCGFVLTH